MPESHSRPCAFCAVHVREWLPSSPHPSENYGVYAGACKSDSRLPPAEPFATGFARPDIANGSSDERSVPPTGQTFHYECFQVLTALDRVPQVSD